MNLSFLTSQMSFGRIIILKKCSKWDDWGEERGKEKMKDQYVVLVCCIEAQLLSRFFICQRFMMSPICCSDNHDRFSR